MSREGFPGGCNPADVLYKLAHNRGIKPPVFEMVSEQGPPHARTFTWSCQFFEGKYQTMAAGRSKKEAKNAVAKALIDQIDLNELPVKAFKGGMGRGGKRKMDMVSDMETEETNGAVENGGGAGGVAGAGKKRKNNKRKSGGGMNPMMMQGGGPGFNDDAFGGFGLGFGVNPNFGGVPRMPMMMPNFGQRPRLNKDDHMVMDKHRSVYPSKEELKLLLKLTDYTERALKKISDKFCTQVVKEEVDGAPVEKEKKNEELREVMGVARIGNLAKGLILTGEKDVSLVVMCKGKPTFSLLNQITTGVAAELKERAEQEKTKAAEREKKKAEERAEKIAKGEEVTEEVKKEGEPIPYGHQELLTLRVEKRPQTAGFRVVYKKPETLEQFVVNVTLTSTKLRPAEKPIKEEKKEGEVKTEENGETKIKEEKMDIVETEEPDPVDMLKRDVCLNALAELRHAKWFSSMAVHVDSCCETIRVLKDIASRDPAWGPVGNWGLELLVEMTLSSAATLLSPANALLRVFECVASGVIAKDGAGIRDPCERDDRDALAHLTGQQIENLTLTAQEMVRKLHYRKLHEILGVEKPLSWKERKALKDAKKPEEEAEVKAE